MKDTTKLDNVQFLRDDYRNAGRVIDQRQKEEKARELAALDARIDVAVQEAYAAGWSIRQIGMAYGSSDYDTIKARIERRVAQENDDAFTLNQDGTLTFRLNGSEAIFDIDYYDFDGVATMVFNADSDQFNASNDAVSALDGIVTGKYYERAVAYVTAHSG